MPSLSKQENNDKRLVFFAINTGVAILYFALAKFSFFLSFNESTSTPIWPASGIALALVIILRKRVWPGIFIGAFVSNFYNFFDSTNEFNLSIVAVSFVIAIGNLIEAELPAFILSRINTEIKLPDSYKALFTFVYAVLMGNIVSATVGNIGLMGFGYLTLEQFPVSFITWMIGGFSSMIGFTPLILSWYKDWRNIEGYIWGRRFLLFFFFSLVLATFIFYFELPFFNKSIHIAFVIPFVLFALYSLPRSLFYLFLALFTLYSTISTILMRGPFAGESYHDSLMMQQYFITTLYLLSYLLNIEINRRFPHLLKYREILDEELDQRKLIGKKSYAQALWISVLIGVFGLLTTTFLWYEFKTDKENEVAERTALVRNRIAGEVEKEVLAHFNALERMGKRFNVQGDAYFNYWREDARNIRKNYEGFRAIEWIDTNLIIREVEPITGNEKAKNLDLNKVENRVAPLLDVIDDSVMNITFNFPLIQGGKSFLVDMPFYYEGRHQGFITGLLEFNKIFAKISKEFEKSYVIIVEDEKSSFFTNDALHPGVEQFKSEVQLNSLLHTPWKLIVMPTSYEVNMSKKVLSTLVLGIGLFATIFLSLIVYLSRVASINAIIADNSLIELKVLNEELQEQKIMAEKASEAKSEFLSMMSHEMRTPLNAIIGMSHLLMSEDLKSEHHENLKVMEFSSQNLLSLINDILDFNKIEAGKVELEEIEFNLVELIRRVKDSLLVKDRDLPIIIEQNKIITHNIVSDPFRLSQVFLNLIGNAVKFTKEGFIKIKIDLYSEDENSYCVRFGVKDTGIGIPSDKHEEIFEMFSQTEKDVTRNYGGTGLGLAITKGILKLMDSEIRVESELGKGAEFSFDLIFRKGNTIGEEQEPVRFDDRVSFDAIYGKKILVVEDNDVNAFVVERFLTKQYAVVEIAENGKVAVEKIINGEYDLVLMDLQMPEMDGFEATKAIRNLSVKQKFDIPIIALTANVTGDVMEKVTSAGIDDYLSKPFTPDELYYIVSKWCKN